MTSCGMFFLFVFFYLILSGWLFYWKPDIYHCLVSILTECSGLSYKSQVYIKTWIAAWNCRLHACYYQAAYFPPVPAFVIFFTMWIWIFFFLLSEVDIVVCVTLHQSGFCHKPTSHVPMSTPCLCHTHTHTLHKTVTLRNSADDNVSLYAITHY